MSNFDYIREYDKFEWLVLAQEAVHDMIEEDDDEDWDDDDEDDEYDDDEDEFDDDEDDEAFYTFRSYYRENMDFLG